MDWPSLKTLESLGLTSILLFPNNSCRRSVCVCFKQSHPVCLHNRAPSCECRQTEASKAGSPLLELTRPQQGPWFPCSAAALTMRPPQWRYFGECRFWSSPAEERLCTPASCVTSTSLKLSPAPAKRVIVVFTYVMFHEGRGDCVNHWLRHITSLAVTTAITVFITTSMPAESTVGENRDRKVVVTVYSVLRSPWFFF